MRPCPHCAQPVGNWEKVCSGCGGDVTGKTLKLAAQVARAPVIAHPDISTAETPPGSPEEPMTALEREGLENDALAERYFRLIFRCAVLAGLAFLALIWLESGRLLEVGLALIVVSIGLGLGGVILRFWLHDFFG